MLYTIRRIRVWSVVRVAFFVFAALGFLAGVLWGTFLWAFSSALGTILPQELEPPQISGVLIALLAIVFAPIQGICGALGAALVAAMYNALGRLTGGLEIELGPKRTELPSDSEIAQECPDDPGC